MDSYWSVEEWNKILRVMARFKDHFLSHPLVNCIGVTRIWKGEIGVLGGDPAIFIGLEEYRPRIESFIPRWLMDYPTVFRRIGRIEMLSIPSHQLLLARTERWRPAPGGVSIGHVKITAGTFGCRVFDKYTGRRLILSNCHVLALNWGTMRVGRKKDPILQPGPIDSGKDPDDRIGYLERWVDVEPYPFENLIDAAVAVPISDDVIRDDVLEIGIPGPVVEPDVGVMVKKSGRTTGLTRAKVICISATVDVSGWGTARFTDQIMTEYMSDPGDSGSFTAVDTPENPTVGLVFAGSREATVVCKSSHIEELLNVSFTPVPIPGVPPIPIVPLMAAGMFVGFLIASAGYSYAKRVKML